MLKTIFLEKNFIVIKAILGTILAINAGNYLALRTDSGYYATFNGELSFWLFPLICLTIIQWIFFSNYLPKNWVISGFIGCILLTLFLSIRYFYFSETVNQNYSIYIFSEFSKGFLVTIPQGILLKNKNGFWWILANSFGWVLTFTYSQTYVHLIEPIPSLPIIQTLVHETYNIPLGLLIGLSFYCIMFESNTVTQKNENK